MSEPIRIRMTPEDTAAARDLCDDAEECAKEAPHKCGCIREHVRFQTMLIRRAADIEAMELTDEDAKKMRRFNLDPNDKRHADAYKLTTIESRERRDG